MTRTPLWYCWNLAMLAALVLLDAVLMGAGG